MRRLGRSVVGRGVGESLIVMRMALAPEKNAAVLLIRV